MLTATTTPSKIATSHHPLTAQLAFCKYTNPTPNPREHLLKHADAECCLFFKFFCQVCGVRAGGILARRQLTAPPMNPSHVFLGLSLMSGVLPKKNPNMYAITSFITTIKMGKMNQINASNMFCKKRKFYCGPQKSTVEGHTKALWRHLET